jgi:hypothetical protein
MPGKYRKILHKIVTFLLLIFILLKLIDYRFKADETISSFQFDYTRLTHVIIPFHIKQLDRLEINILKWKQYVPCLDMEKRNAPKLIFFVSYSNNASIVALKERLNRLRSYYSCFSSVHYVEYYFKRSELDNHIAGARLMFEHMLAQKDAQFNDAQYVFYMEPDCRPIKSYWLDAVTKDLGFNEFWMKGAIYRGIFEFKVNVYLPNKYHINGNALYNIGNKEFQEFYFKTLRPFIERHGDSMNAYDTDFAEYFFDVNNYETVRKILHNFVLTETWQNLWQTNFSIIELNKMYRNTYLVHGGFPNDW